MNFDALVAEYGYAALGIWVMLEGESPLIVGGILAQRGSLLLAGVIGVCTACTLVADQSMYWLGRRGGRGWLDRRPKLQPASGRASALIERYPVAIAAGFRFLYGLRTVTPFMIGVSGAIAPGRFVLLNLAGTLVWAAIYAAAGFVFGEAATRLLDDVGSHKGEMLAALVVAIGGLIFWRGRQRRKPAPDAAARPGSIH